MPHCSSCGNLYEGSPKFCPSCGSPINPPQKETETTPVTSTRERKTGPIIYSALILFGLGLFVFYITPSTNKVIRAQPVVSAPGDYDSNTVKMASVSFHEEGSDLVFSLDEVKSQKLVVFQYLGGKTPRSIMAYIAPDGRLVTAISLSEHCGSTEFTIRNNQIYCAHCPSHWDMMTMEAYACCAQYFPDPIPSKVVNDEVHVSKKVVEEWAGRL